VLGDRGGRAEAGRLLWGGGKANDHNDHVPRDHWLLDEEKPRSSL
jgi:hypothetical protein